MTAMYKMTEKVRARIALQDWLNEVCWIISEFCFFPEFWYE